MNLNVGADPISMLWTRWVGYAMSCTFLTASMVDIFKITGNKKIVALASTSLIMLTGILAAVATSTTFLIIFFLLGMIPFISIISIFQSKANSQNGYVMNYLYYGWMAFPVIFILSPETFSIVPSISIILVAYLIADCFTKIVFYFHINKLQ
jgi:bacteriorhodopsin